MSVFPRIKPLEGAQKGAQSPSGVRVRCTACGQYEVLPVTPEAVHAWRAGRALVQDAFPQLSADQRELLISQTCGRCFDAMFAEEGRA